MDKKHQIKAFYLVLIGLILITGCLQTEKTADDSKTDNNVQIANPASVFCEEQGGKLEIRTAPEGGQVGYCIFEDGSECEEWAFFRGDC